MALPRIGVLATIAFVWLVGLLSGMTICGCSRNESTAESGDIEPSADPQLASLDRRYEEWQAHQLLEDHRNARR
jgi:hypothetical protein